LTYRDSRTGRQELGAPPPLSPSVERDSPSAALPLCLVCAVLRPKGQEMGHTSYDQTAQQAAGHFFNLLAYSH